MPETTLSIPLIAHKEKIGTHVFFKKKTGTILFIPAIIVNLRVSSSTSLMENCLKYPVIPGLVWHERHISVNIHVQFEKEISK